MSFLFSCKNMNIFYFEKIRKLNRVHNLYKVFFCHLNFNQKSSLKLNKNNRTQDSWVAFVVRLFKLYFFADVLPIMWTASKLCYWIRRLYRVWSNKHYWLLFCFCFCFWKANSKLWGKQTLLLVSKWCNYSQNIGIWFQIFNCSEIQF